MWSPDQLSAEEEKCRRNIEYLIQRHAIIKSKNGKLQLLNPLTLAQRKVLAAISLLEKDNKPVRLIIGKSRKRGISSLIEFHMLWKVIENGLDAMVIAHNQKTSNYIFGIARRYYEWWDQAFDESIPPLVKPAVEGARVPRREMRFKGHEGYIMVETAGDTQAGTGTTPQYCHFSETSKWVHGDETATALYQAIGDEPGTYIIIESTFNGYDPLFLPEWENASACANLTFTKEDNELTAKLEVKDHLNWNGYVPLFISAMDDESIPKEFHDKAEREAFIDSLDDYERKAINELGASLEFMRGLRYVLLNKCQGKLHKRKQEYPLTADEAVQGSGRARFNKDHIDVITKLEDGQVGIFHKANDWSKSILWRNDSMMWVTKFRDAVPSHRYIIGVDVAEGKLDDLGKEADASVATVHDLDHNMEQVAVLQGQDLGEEYLVEPLVLMALYYNHAFIVCESNNTGKHVCIQLGAGNYDKSKLYHKDDWQGERSRSRREIGWRTTNINKPSLIGELATAVETHGLVIHSKDTHRELTRFIKDGGKTRAESGYHDDHVIAVGLAVIGAITYNKLFRLQEVPEYAQRYKIPEAREEGRDSIVGY